MKGKEVILEVGRKKEPPHYWFYTWCVFSMLVVSCGGIAVSLLAFPLTSPLLYVSVGLFSLAVLLTKSKKQGMKMDIRLEDFRPILPFGKRWKEVIRKERELRDENEGDIEELRAEKKDE